MDKEKDAKVRSMASAHAAPRCLARNRSGTPCQRPASKGKRRCHMHGGAAGIGAPKGNRNSWKHGHYSAEAVEARRMIRALLRRATDLTD